METEQLTGQHMNIEGFKGGVLKALFPCCYTNYGRKSIERSDTSKHGCILKNSQGKVNEHLKDGTRLSIIRTKT